jgi:hypothetical protein
MFNILTAGSYIGLPVSTVERLNVNYKVATVLGSISASSDTVE